LAPAVHTSLMLLALPLMAALALFAPTSCGCRLDLHPGQPLHPVFDHPHPHAPTEIDELAVSLGATQLQGAHVLDHVGSLSVSGQLAPRVAIPPELSQLSGRLVRWTSLEPASISSAPRDPPPESA
jgi:hypothetical protein